MRKIVSLGLCALMASLFSQATFADPADGDCEILNELNASPGLYGLCVAYQNADENGRIRILENYRKKMKFGDRDMPGTATCPCWDEESLKALTKDRSLSSCGTTVAGSGSIIFDYLAYSNNDFQLATLNIGNGSMFMCAIANATMPVATEAEDAECRKLLETHEPTCVFD